MRIFDGFEELIGGTPLVRLNRFAALRGLHTAPLVKLERQNPAGSAKDRAAKRMLDDAEKSGQLTKGTVIIEPTSGNTGVALAALASVRGYEIILTMPDTMSTERISLLKAYGAKVVLTPGKEGMSGAIARAKALAEEYQKSYIPSQFCNPSNAKAHFDTTGPEIWRDTDGQIAAFVAGVGTGGTITGTGEYLKQMNPCVHIVAVEPDTSPVLSGGKAGAHGLQGIGAGFVPEVLDVRIIDEVITVSKEEAYRAAKELARSEGLLCGITSGAALYAACQLLSREEFIGKQVVALVPDTGERYLSTGMFD